MRRQPDRTPPTAAAPRGRRRVPPARRTEAGRAVLAGCAVALAIGAAGCAAEDPGISIGGPITSSGPATPTTGAPATTPAAATTPAGDPPPATTPAAANTPVAAPTTGPAATTTRAPVPVPCRTADLEVGFGTFVLTDRTDGYGPLELTNTGDRTCTLSGWATLRLLTPADVPIEVTTARQSTPAPATVRLAPGDTAVSTLRFLIQPPTTRAVCRTPTTAEVVPPGRTAGFRTLWPYGRICSTLTVSAVRSEG